MSVNSLTASMNNLTTSSSPVDINLMDPNDTISVLCSDSDASNVEDRYKLKLKYVKYSKTLVHLLEDSGVADDIPLPNITKKEVQIIVDFLELTFANSKVVDTTNDDVVTNHVNDNAQPFQVEFCAKLDDPTLYSLASVANYLDIKSLIAATTDAIRDQLLGKLPEELCAKFGVTNDFTAEEREEAKRQCEFSEER